MEGAGSDARLRLASNRSVQAIEVYLKREIALLESEKSLEDLYYTADVRLIGIHCFKGLPKRVCWLDARQILGNVLLDAMKHPSDNG